MLDIIQKNRIYKSNERETNKAIKKYEKEKRKGKWKNNFL